MDDTFKNKEILAIRNKTDLQHYFGGLNIFKPLLIYSVLSLSHSSTLIEPTWLMRIGHKIIWFTTLQVVPECWRFILEERARWELVARLLGMIWRVNRIEHHCNSFPRYKESEIDLGIILVFWLVLIMDRVPTLCWRAELLADLGIWDSFFCTVSFSNHYNKALFLLILFSIITVSLLYCFGTYHTLYLN
jgi:hypothetical protein